MARLSFRNFKFASAALAGLAFGVAAPAQGFPDVDVTPDWNDMHVAFQLNDPTLLPWPDNPHAMLVCYINVVDDGGQWAKLVKFSTQAVNTYPASPPPTGNNNANNAWAAAITGANATADTTGTYTIPPSIISAAVAEVQWSTSAFPNYAKEFAATMPWPTTGWGTGSTMNWGTLASPILGTSFDVDKLMRACLARQIGYVLNKPVEDVEVQANVTAVMGMASINQIAMELNTVIVEFQDQPGNAPTPPTIRLSRTKKITIQMPGMGSELDYFRVFDAYPFFDDLNEGTSILRVETAWSNPPVMGDYFLFLPNVLGGYTMQPATVYDGLASFGLECPIPPGTATGEILAWNNTALEIVPLVGQSGPFIYKVDVPVN